MCLLRGIYVLRFRSCLQLNVEWRQKSPERYTTPTDWREEKERRHENTARQVPERCWRAGEETRHSPECCRQQDASLSSTKASFAAPSPPYTASGMSTSRSSILLPCHSLSQPTMELCFTLLYRFQFMLVPQCCINAGSSGVLLGMYHGELWNAMGSIGDGSGILQLGGYIKPWPSETGVAQQHSWCGVNSSMFHNVRQF